MHARATSLALFMWMAGCTNAARPAEPQVGPDGKADFYDILDHVWIVGELKPGHTDSSSWGYFSQRIGWYFHAKKGDHIRLYTGKNNPNPEDEEVDTNLELFRAGEDHQPIDDASLAENDDAETATSVSQLDFKAPETRDYLALVTPVGGWSLSDVYLTLSLNSDQSCGWQDDASPNAATKKSCAKILGFRWVGFCQVVYGCKCVGSDCDEIAATRSECEKHHSTCASNAVDDWCTKESQCEENQCDRGDAECRANIMCAGNECQEIFD